MERFELAVGFGILSAELGLELAVRDEVVFFFPGHLGCAADHPIEGRILWFSFMKREVGGFSRPPCGG